MKNGFALALALALGTGCHEKPVDTVFAVVNGRSITANYVRDVVLIRAKMSELSGHRIPEDKFVHWANGLAAKALSGLISAELLDAELIRRGEEAEQTDVEKTLAGYCQGMSKPMTNVNELARLFGPQEAAFRVQFARSARFSAFNRRHVPPVTERDVADYLRGQSNRLEWAKKIDAIAWQRARKACERLGNGESWASVAKDCSEDALQDEANASFAEEWATVGADGFGYPELALALPKLEAGAWSQPVETDEGLLVVKVIERTKDKWTLARMLFRLAEPVEIPSVEEVRMELPLQRQHEVQLNLQRELMKKAKIEYPLGTNFTCQIWADEKPAKSSHASRIYPNKEGR